MKLVSQVVSTCSPTMPVIDCEEGASGPFFNLFELRFDYVQYNAYPIFVIVPHDPLMCIGRVATYNTVLFAGELGWMIGLNIPIDLFLLHLHIFLLLLGRHDETSVRHQLVLRLRLGQTALIMPSSLLLLRARLLFNYLLMVG